MRNFSTYNSFKADTQDEHKKTTIVKKKLTDKVITELHSTLKLPQQLMTLIKMLQQILPLSVYHHITANKIN